MNGNGTPDGPKLSKNNAFGGTNEAPDPLPAGIPGVSRVALLLAGGGHAQLEVLRALARARSHPFDATLVSTEERALYSGMVPGYLAGRYHEDEIAFDLPGLAASAGARFVRGRVTGVSSSRSIVSLEDGRDLPFDLLSLCLGSGVAGAGTPGVSRWAASVKPIHRARETRERLLAVAGKGTGTRSGDVAVVGAGSAGVEIACAAARVLADRQSRGRVHLLDRGRLLPEGTDAEREALRRILAARG